MLSAIIVDDEQKSIKSLELLLHLHCPEVNVIGNASNALEAVKKIISLKPNVVFLDIQMPGYDGFDVLAQIKESGSTVVFITAHQEYAISALRQGAFDYLLKPFDENELKNCIKRLKEIAHKTISSSNVRHTVIELNIKSGIIYVKPEEIIYLNASGSYTEFFIDNNVKHLVSRNMKSFEGQLSPDLFFRCHNSFIINLRKVKRFSSVDGLFAEMINGNKVSIARKNKDTFLKKIKHLGE